MLRPPEPSLPTLRRLLRPRLGAEGRTWSPSPTSASGVTKSQSLLSASGRRAMSSVSYIPTGIPPWLRDSLARGAGTWVHCPTQLQNTLVGQSLHLLPHPDQGCPSPQPKPRQELWWVHGQSGMGCMWERQQGEIGRWREEGKVGGVDELMSGEVDGWVLLPKQTWKWPLSPSGHFIVGETEA